MRIKSGEKSDCVATTNDINATKIKTKKSKPKKSNKIDMC